MNAETKIVTVNEVLAVRAKVGGMHQKMTFLKTLTPEQRSEYKGRSIGAKKLQLMQNRLGAARQNAGLLPSTFDLDMLEQDIALTVALFDLTVAVEGMLESLYDTLAVNGHPAMVTAATAHAHIKVAVRTSQRLQPTNTPRKGRSIRTAAVPVGLSAPAEPSVGPVLTLPAPAVKQAA